MLHSTVHTIATVLMASLDPSVKWVGMATDYCKFGNFRENFIFANTLKDIFAKLKIRDQVMIYLQ